LCYIERTDHLPLNYQPELPKVEQKSCTQQFEEALLFTLLYFR